MKRVKVFLVATLSIVLVVAAISIFRSSNYLVQIYTSYHGQDVYSIFGYVPQEFKGNLRIDTTENQEQYSLIKVRYLKTTIQSWYHLLVYEGNEEFIKAHPYNLVGVRNTKSINVSNGTAKLINLYAFNQYTELAELQTRDEVINRFAYFLSDEQDYKLIESIPDLMQVKGKWPSSSWWKEMEEKMFGDNLIEIQELILDDDYVYIWYKGRGLIQFEFEFRNEIEIANVESIHIGYIGIEEPYCC